MKRIKELIERIKNKSDFLKSKLINTKLVKTIKIVINAKKTMDENENLLKQIRGLNDLVSTTRIERDKYKEESSRIPNLEIIIKEADESIKKKNKEIDYLKNRALEAETDAFNKNNELIKANSIIYEKDEEIKELKSERYLVRKIKPGKTPNTIKTKVSKPMSARVTKYMRGEHE